MSLRIFLVSNNHQPQQQIDLIFKVVMISYIVRISKNLKVAHSEAHTLHRLLIFRMRDKLDRKVRKRRNQVRNRPLVKSTTWMFQKLISQRKRKFQGQYLRMEVVVIIVAKAHLKSNITQIAQLS